jgi:hypothetical protein
MISIEVYVIGLLISILILYSINMFGIHTKLLDLNNVFIYVFWFIFTPIYVYKKIDIEIRERKALRECTRMVINSLREGKGLEYIKSEERKIYNRYGLKTLQDKIDSLIENTTK